MNAEKIKSLQPQAIAELRGLVAAATPGPWTRGEDGGDIIYGPEWKDQKVHVAAVPFRPGDKRVDSDAALIVAAVTSLPALLTAGESLLEENQKLKDEVEALTALLGRVQTHIAVGCGARIGYRTAHNKLAAEINEATARHEPTKSPQDLKDAER